VKISVPLYFLFVAAATPRWGDQRFGFTSFSREFLQLPDGPCGGFSSFTGETRNGTRRGKVSYRVPVIRCDKRFVVEFAQRRENPPRISTA
jgi:hypothetical protein